MIPNEIFTFDHVTTVICYGLYIGLAYHIYKIVGFIRFTIQHKNNQHQDKACPDCDICNSEPLLPDGGESPANSVVFFYFGGNLGGIRPLEGFPEGNIKVGQMSETSLKV